MVPFSHEIALIKVHDLHENEIIDDDFLHVFDIIEMKKG